MLQIENLSVSYGSVRALSDVDLEVRGDGILHGVSDRGGEQLRERGESSFEVLR